MKPVTTAKGFHRLCGKTGRDRICPWLGLKPETDVKELEVVGETEEQEGEEKTPSQEAVKFPTSREGKGWGGWQDIVLLIFP